jgi:hypothetical protein
MLFRGNWKHFLSAGGIRPLVAGGGIPVGPEEKGNRSRLIMPYGSARIGKITRVGKGRRDERVAYLAFTT